MTVHQILTTVIEMQKETGTDTGEDIQMTRMIRILNQRLKEQGMIQHQIVSQTQGMSGNLS